MNGTHTPCIHCRQIYVVWTYTENKLQCLYCNKLTVDKETQRRYKRNFLCDTCNWKIRKEHIDSYHVAISLV